MNDAKEIDINLVKKLTELVVEDKELFLLFIRRLACEETQGMTEPVASSLPAESNISL